ncbi:transcriptional regulator [Streptomyces sp. DK15]|uniref:helix-turn-helix domain-containing protein n=1 Tax=Streptomyces sp. DK15 TaxID=2957499 RepID=UPI0029A96C31|nr:helix-turn-helix transcriptional regulator [Streptomyces sp. DK15]MDX2393777.1 transcriptional regulator [Streptomyces sp. DK15]
MAVVEEDDSVFGDMLRAELDRLGMPPELFAARAGISMRRLREIVSGQVRPSAAYRQQLLDALDRLRETHEASDFGAALKQERQDRGLTRAELARRMGLSLNIIVAIENGEHRPPDSVRGQLLAALRDNRHPDLPARVQPYQESIPTGRRLPQGADRDRYAIGNALVPSGRNGRGYAGGRAGGPMLSQTGKPDPLLISTPVDFVEMLGAVHVWAGAPSMRSLEINSEGLLKRSTISDALNVERVRKLGKIPSLEWCQTFLQVCGIRGTEDWVYAWRRLKALERPQSGKWLQG